MPGAPTKIELLSLDLQELTSLIEERGQASYRGRQLFSALFHERRKGLEEITTLPLGLRQRLITEGVRVGLPAVEKQFHSSDGTIRYLMSLSDGESVETVWMPEGDGGEAGDGSQAGSEEMPDAGAERPFRRATICVSSQVGCAVNCRFCLTALLGVKRNLGAGEIAGQVLAVLNERGVKVGKERINLVFMGMGEPFLNYENFIKAVRLLAEGAGIAASRMTVSTAGIVPRIEDLGKEAVRPKLAISLNAPNDPLRERIMPLNRKWNIAALLEAARRFPLHPRERLTFEYVLLHEVNDRPEHAHELKNLIKGIRAKVNLIGLNPGPGIGFATPEEAAVLAFQRVLTDSGIPAFIRRPRGRDIYAACGQLKRTLA